MSSPAPPKTIHGTSTVDGLSAQSLLCPGAHLGLPALHGDQRRILAIAAVNHGDGKARSECSGAMV